MTEWMLEGAPLNLLGRDEEGGQRWEPGEADPSPCAVSTPALAGPQMCNLSHKGVDPAATGDELVDVLEVVSPGGLEVWALGNPEAVPASPHQCLEPAAESVLLPDTSRPSPRPPRPPATLTQGGLREASSEPEFLLRCD